MMLADTSQEERMRAALAFLRPRVGVTQVPAA
jgi:hypothetical protein